MRFRSPEKNMSSEMNVQFVHRETSKPSSPTPHYHKTTNISVIDQLMPECYVPLLLFYPEASENSSKRSNILKVSLSKTLTHFYPFVGHFQWNHSICCDDHGAAFVEAKVNCPISKILDKPDLHLGMLKQMVPADFLSKQPVTGHLLLVQANFFECGGLAIGVSVSHKVADAYTLCAFIKTWAATANALLSANSTGDGVVLPGEFGGAASLFPPQDFLNTPTPAVELAVQDCLVTRRFVFDASKIAALKSKAASTTVPSPTRVEAVSALIWKCAMETSRRNLGYVRSSAWCQAVNMRKIFAGVRPLGESLLGNVVGFLIARTEGREGDHDLQSLVGKFRKGIEQFKVNYGKGITVDDACEMYKEYENLLNRDDIDNYVCTSWCWFSFYAANFGWGDPSWVSVPGLELKNVVTMMDSSDGDGIEVALTLKEEDMTIVENNKELLAYMLV